MFAFIFHRKKQTQKKKKIKFYIIPSIVNINEYEISNFITNRRPIVDVHEQFKCSLICLGDFDRYKVKFGEFVDAILVNVKKLQIISSVLNTKTPLNVFLNRFSSHETVTTFKQFVFMNKLLSSPFTWFDLSILIKHYPINAIVIQNQCRSDHNGKIFMSKPDFPTHMFLFHDTNNIDYLGVCNQQDLDQINMLVYCRRDLD